VCVCVCVVFVCVVCVCSVCVCVCVCVSCTMCVLGLMHIYTPSYTIFAWLNATPLMVAASMPDFKLQALTLFPSIEWQSILVY